MKNKNQKISLKFMDVKVELQGSKDIDKRALRLLTTLVKDRLRVFELLSELNEYDDDYAEKRKVKKVKAEINCVMYQ